MNRLTDKERKALMGDIRSFDEQMPCVGVFRSGLPIGGLSSSAAVLIAHVMAFAKANNFSLEPFEVETIASDAEREYIGLNNGLLHQAYIALGKKDHLLMLDRESNEYRLIPKAAYMPDFELGIFLS